jgi:hypothetical protein
MGKSCWFCGRFITNKDGKQLINKTTHIKRWMCDRCLSKGFLFQNGVIEPIVQFWEDAK